MRGLGALKNFARTLPTFYKKFLENVFMRKFSMADVQRAWEEATIQNNFIFSKTMEMYPELCKQLIEMILKIKISRIEYPEREKNIEERIDSKGVRLDVYVEDKNFNRSLLTFFIVKNYFSVL